MKKHLEAIETGVEVKGLFGTGTMDVEGALYPAGNGKIGRNYAGQ